jgi:1-aminocyclopropane-1-carboxylate deaminase
MTFFIKLILEDFEFLVLNLLNQRRNSQPCFSNKFLPFDPAHVHKSIAMPTLFASLEAWIPVLTPGAVSMNLKKFPRHSLTFGPTPIQPLKRLSAHLGGQVELYAKREDCNSGLAFGGNKTRKLEYLIPEAIEGGYDTLVSIGGIQSNQTRQVAAVAAHLGMKCVLVQENWVNYSDAVYDRVGNIEMSRIMGADVRLDAAGFDIGIRKSWEQAMDDVRKAGGKPFPIPAGCSEHPRGGLGFVGFAEEVRQQEKELGFKFDYIVTCSVTGSTQAGMVVGFAADGRADRVIGIDASAKPHRPSTRSCASPRARPTSWNSAAPSPPTTWCSTAASGARNTVCPTKARWKRFACAHVWKAC